MQDSTIKNELLLVRNLSKGNILAFNTLYKEYSSRLYRFAYGYLKSEAEAEELVQEVFTIIWEKRADLKEELSFRSFLFTIAFNIIRKHFRTKGYLSEYFTTGISAEPDVQTSQKIAYNSLYQYITELVNQLTDALKFIRTNLNRESIHAILFFVLFISS